jgi:hypothetical protein
MEKEQTFDYPHTDVDKKVLENLTKMGEYLKDLKLKMETAEAEFNAAKKEYDYYSSSVLPMEMFNAGVSSVELMNGERMTYERKFYCTPNRNTADKKVMADWLHTHGGGDLVRTKAEVDASQIESLRVAGIPYTEINDIDSNVLKSFLKDMIGAMGGTVKIQVTDILDCMHFKELRIVDIV